MRTKLITAILVLALGAVVPLLAVCPRRPTRCKYRFRRPPTEVPGPGPGNTMTPAYVQLVGRMAYVWGYRAGERAQPPGGVCRSARARTAGRCRAGGAGRLQRRC